jgi:prepilin-type processing-associated H-X9-DG protein
MLLPALSQARERARAAVCINNLKQLGLAFMMYIDDHEGYIPYRGPGTGGSAENWHARFYINGYLSSPIPATGVWAPRSRIVTICPSFAKPGPQGGAFNWRVGESGPRWDSTTYAVNNNLCAGTGEALIKQSRVVKPSQKILLIGVANSMSTRYSVVDNATYPLLMHGQGCNILFVDGHVSWHFDESIPRDYFHGVIWGKWSAAQRYAWWTVDGE